MIKLICPFIAVLVLIVLPLWLIVRRARAGKSVKKPLYANLAGFFVVMFATAFVFLGQGVAAANEAAEAAAAAGATDWTKAIGYRHLGHSLGHSGVEFGLRRHRRPDRERGQLRQVHRVRRHGRGHSHLRPAHRHRHIAVLMRCFCITDDADVLTGMRLAGIEGARAATKKEVDAAISRACADAGVAVLIVTEGCYALSRERLDELKLSAGRPLVNIVADSRGSVRARDYITRLINEAIGIKL